MVAIIVWRLPFYVVLPVWLIFAALDGAFLSSVFFKVPQGAWFTLMLAIILASFFTLWRFGKEEQWKAESRDQLSPRSLLDFTDPSSISLASAFGGLPVSTVPGLGIFFDKAGDNARLPPCFAQFVTKFAARPAVIVLFHMRPLPLPTIALDERYVVTRTSKIPGCYSVSLRHGYTDHVLHDGMARELVGQIELAVSRSGSSSETQAELEQLRAAYNSQMVYILGKETLKIRMPEKGFRSPMGFVRAGFLWLFLWVRENSRSKLAELDIDTNKVIEVGFVKEI